METEKVTGRNVAELVGRMVIPNIELLPATFAGESVLLRGELVGGDDAEPIGIHVSAKTVSGRGDVMEVYIFKIDDDGRYLSPHDTDWGYRLEALIDRNPGDKGVSRTVSAMGVIGELGDAGVDARKEVIEAFRKRLVERLRWMLGLLRNSDFTDNWFESQTPVAEIYEMVQTRRLIGARC